VTAVAACVGRRWSNHFNSNGALWYGLASVRVLPIAFLVIAACGGRGGQIRNLPLAWRGNDGSPKPSASVARSFAAMPLEFGLRDVRPDPSAVGTYEGSGFVVRTTDNVAQYCSSRLGDMLARAGARLAEPPKAALEAELIEYTVVESETYTGLVRLRAILRRGATEAWSKTYVGKSKRWGRTHRPENFNDALSNALADAATQLVQDEEFARALVGDPAAAPPPPPGYPRPSGG
jgi:hypothetical protein